MYIIICIKQGGSLRRVSKAIYRTRYSYKEMVLEDSL